MEIEDIINKVRFTSSEDRDARRHSAREIPDRSIISESKSAPESISCLDTTSSDDYVTYESNVSQTTPARSQWQGNIDAEVQPELRSPSHQERARTTSNTQNAQQVPKRPSLQHPQSMALSYSHAMPAMYFAAYMVVPMYIPPANHIASVSASYPGSFPIHQRPHHKSQHQRWTHEEENDCPKPVPRGVRISPLPGSLRRAQNNGKRKFVQPKKKKKRVKVPPVVHDYNDLSVEEAIQELARRNIHITDRQQIDISKTTLVSLLQRADRNHNKGNGKSSEFERPTAPSSAA